MRVQMQIPEAPLPGLVPEIPNEGPAACIPTRPPGDPQRTTDTGLVRGKGLIEQRYREDLWAGQMSHAEPGGRRGEGGKVETILYPSTQAATA